jgi:hypothetical protein
MAVTTRHNESSEDIDLLVLVERSILFFKKYFIVFLIAGILGLALGFYFYKSIPKTFRSRMVVHSFILSNQEEIQIVKNWNQLLTKGEHSTLSSIFNIPVAVFRYVKKIKAEEIQQVFSQVNPNGFTIDVLVTDNKVLPDLQKGIVFGFENSAYIKDRLKLKREILTELVEKTANEIKKLELTKANLENIIGGKETNNSSLIIDGSSINRQWVEMNEKLLSLKETLQFTAAVQVLQGFEAFHKPTGPHLLPWLIIGLFGGLAIAYLYSLVHSINKKLKQRSRLSETIIEGTP